MKKTIHFIRHGQTLYNNLGKIQGSVDVPLSEVGITQANNFCKSNFIKERYDIAYTSNMERSKNTLKLIIQKLDYNITTIIDNDLRERAYGIFEGLDTNEIKINYPDIYKEWQNNENAKIPDSESIESVVLRILKFIDNFSKSKYNNGIVVTHSGVLYSLFKNISNISLSERPTEITFPNCCSTYLDIYIENNTISKLEFTIGSETYVSCCSPTKMIISTSFVSV